MVTLDISVPSNAAFGHILDASFGNCLGGSGPLRKSQNLTFSVVTHLIPLLGDLGCPPKKEFHIMGVMLTVGVTNTELGRRERGGWREGGRWE